MPESVAGQPFGRYVLEEKIAAGGMAEIFKARYRAEHDFEKVVVIKRILPELSADPEFVEMFRAEAVLSVKLTHANIVQVFDFGRQGKDHFLAMEFVHGRNMRQVIRRFSQSAHPRTPIQFAVYVASEVARGLAYAHSRTTENGTNLGVIHRDVTPSNILVSFEGEVKVADFGIAKAVSRAGVNTREGMVRGKVHYFAPEQLLGKTVDARVDQFALGNVLWEMLAGRKLASGETDPEVMGKIMAGRWDPPSKLNPKVSEELDRVVMKAIAADPGDRYATMEHFARDLGKLVSRMEVSPSYVREVMKHLFAEELAEEAAKPRPVLPVKGPSMAATVAPAAEPAVPADPATSPHGTRTLGKGVETERTPPADFPVVKPRGSTPALALAAGGAFVLLVAVALGKWIGSGTEAPVVTTPLPVASPVRTVAAATATAASRITQAPPPAVTPEATSTTAPVAVRTAIPTTPAPVTGFAKISVDSRPWGRIYVDGKDTGRNTPAFEIEVSAGDREIRIVNPDQRMAVSTSVRLRTGENRKLGTLKLEPVR